MNKQPTRPDLLDAFAKLGVPAPSFEKTHGLPKNLIGRMKQGAYASPGAAGTIAKLEAALGLPASAASDQKGPGRPRWKADAEVEKDLLERIRGATTSAAKDELLRHILELSSQGKVASEFARLAGDLVGQMRQLGKQSLEEQERARAGEEVVVRIEYVDDWRKGERE